MVIHHMVYYSETRLNMYPEKVKISVCKANVNLHLHDAKKNLILFNTVLQKNKGSLEAATRSSH